MDITKDLYSATYMPFSGIVGFHRNGIFFFEMKWQSKELSIDATVHPRPEYDECRRVADAYLAKVKDQPGDVDDVMAKPSWPDGGFLQ